MAMSILLLTAFLSIHAQSIKIAGNVYGGGNAGDLVGKTSVTICSGDIHGAVFGGARRANVGGSTMVNIDGEHITGDITINAVYGGNDISGKIGKSARVPEVIADSTLNGITSDYNTFVHASAERTAGTGETQRHIFIGQLFGGGNGFYTYTSTVEDGNTVYQILDGEGNEIARSDSAWIKPELDRTCVDIHGGTYGYVFGGGNNVTVSEAVDICIDNHSEPTMEANGLDFHFQDNDHPNGVTPIGSFNFIGTIPPTDLRLLNMGINLSTFVNNVNFLRVFGGNNKHDMHIRPTWHLYDGSIYNLYSGGNEGRMTSSDGLLLEIPEGSNIVVENVYGGCRKADVYPTRDVAGTIPMVEVKDLVGYYFPSNMAARVLVRGGDIKNVYGGNDISGKVYFGNAIGVYTSIRGDIYGGGNGSYAYTDNPVLKDDIIWGDFYYDKGSSSIDSLNNFRPNAEQVSIRVKGTLENRTIIHGSIYVGGNCATIVKRPGAEKTLAELKIGSHVIADEVFIGNNGENMVDPSPDGVLALYAGDVTYVGNQNNPTPQPHIDFSSLNLEDSETFASYMEGVTMAVAPMVVFDNGYPEYYEPYTSFFGSFYCGGNVGSIRNDALTQINFNHKVVIYEKLVGGCKNAYVPRRAGLNAAFDGGLIGTPNRSLDKLELNLSGMKIIPMRWPIAGIDDNASLPNLPLVWNTIKREFAANGDPIPVAWNDNTWNGDQLHSTIDRRLYGGNIYGGCYESGHVNGNVIINVNGTIIEREGIYGVFDSVEGDESGEAKLYDNDDYNITTVRSGVILDEQGMDVLGTALNIYGGGYGVKSEIWGNARINLNRGYVFQIFGGGQEGAIGKGVRDANGVPQYDRARDYDEQYSTYITMHGLIEGKSKQDEMSEDLAECEFIYGGGFDGLIAGSTHINLGNGRLFNTFAGSCNADIFGHTETYIGEWTEGEETKTGFPWIRDHLYGGNDLGGHILGSKDFKDRVTPVTLPKVWRYDASQGTSPVLNASTYMEYTRGRVENIFGGCYGDYDYSEYTSRVSKKPWFDNAFVNIRPQEDGTNMLEKVFGAGQGTDGERDGDKMQDRSYILIDIPDGLNNFRQTEIFGAGSFDGLGMRYTQSESTADSFDKDRSSAIIDLIRGQVNAAYGGSYQQGITRRTFVNVPSTSTIKINNIFGGAYGLTNEKPCDVFEAKVSYSSPTAIVGNCIYGGNNNSRRTLYGTIDINSPVYINVGKDSLATVYGAGYGVETWSQYTEVNLNNGARVAEVYGGGQNGQVLNLETISGLASGNSSYLYLDGYTDNGLADNLARSNKLYEVSPSFPGSPTYLEKNNCNVHIKEGAEVKYYAYGGGLGNQNISHSGNVYGTTYIDLLGGIVNKDLYAAGTIGSVKDTLNVGGDFIATSTAYIEGGTARNVYGGGWRGTVGQHNGDLTASYTTDTPGVTNVIIGKVDGTNILNGLPAIERNAYGGGEGGAVFGTANITLLNGYVGYRYHPDWSDNSDTPDIDERYEEKTDDETWKDGVGANRLYDSGCVFGGGYIDNSSVDQTNVRMLGGHVRNSLFGGGEIAAVGRGVIQASGTDNSIRTLQGIYKAGRTFVELYHGQVHRNVFGGGRGYNNLGEGGTLYSDGYVFGQTEVHIFGGEVGTKSGTSQGFGNVFGGGDIGFVYSAYEQDGQLRFGKKAGARYVDADEGYYYRSDGTNYLDEDGNVLASNAEKQLTEDCKVLVEPHCLVNSPVTINGHSYNTGDYVPIDDLNTMANKNNDSNWQKLDNTGIIIHNAVFAGGNASSGSSQVYANTTTIFGNATASIYDVFHRDLITLGSGRIGGLYGDGNLTFVDGYRGLNITNYGTDYYSIAKEITITQYHALSEREQAYYELRYKCIQECVDKDGTHYTTDEGGGKASTLTADDILTLFDGVTDNGVSLIVENEDGELVPNPSYWKENGVCSIYAGRPMNTIQRADFCGVFGSRMVMQGAQDRVPEVVDYKNYTINRVREVSLNKKTSVAGDGVVNGNYFGIYSLVNFLGALTSDVNFGDEGSGGTTGDVGTGDVRTSDNTDTGTYGPDYTNQTFYGWKKRHVNERKRNNGNSHNKVALASGVYLELTTERSTGDGIFEKDWGLITGVVELDLINVQPGIGGGFVYAKNEHGVRRPSGRTHVTLTALNRTAVTSDDYLYDTSDSNKKAWQTSGNFVHSTQTIIDDCYNVSGRYTGSNAMPAHYWYIQGSVYVYDQYISAYTGAPNAYSETVEIPLTITAASNGTMKLLTVMPNLYAYYSYYDANNSANSVALETGKKIVINDVTYEKNDPISYWDWYLLSKSEKNLFVEETYVSIADCKIGQDTIPSGTVLLPSKYNQWKQSHPQVYHIGKQRNVNFEEVFHPSNNLSHDTGYILTYKVNNPKEWDTWYTKVLGAWNDKMSTEEYNNENGYEDGPTYHYNGTSGGVLGQREYSVSNIISKDVYDTYQEILRDHEEDIPSGQASFERAWMVTKQVTIEGSAGGQTYHYNPGSTVSATTAATPALSGCVEEAYVCTSTIQLASTEYIYLNTKMTLSEKTAYINRFRESNPQLAQEIDDNVVPAYYCTSDGLYGGNYYEANKNYRGLTAWSSMSDNDRAHFIFNYDALDLLIDPMYSKNAQGNFVHPEGEKYQYDGLGYTSASDASQNPAGYSLTRHVDYSATYNGTSPLTYGNGQSVAVNEEIGRETFEQIPNEKRHYTAIGVSAAGNVRVVNYPFQVGNTPYAVGTTISENTYNGLSNDEKNLITTLTFTSSDVGNTYYFCRESYTVGEHGEGQQVTNANVTGSETGTYSNNQVVPVGLVIDSSTYGTLVNKQTNFTIHGVAPTETSTLYVSRNSDIFDLSKEKIITVVYQYDYEESDANATHITPVSERHVVNIHIQFKSGIPSVEDIKAPQIVIPGDMVSLREPNVTPGAYEVTGGGWELFEKVGDAESHINGIEFTPGIDPMYWYQDGYYVAYYAKTYLGKTYSNHEQVKVANYHDLKRVMEAKSHHYYIDIPDLVKTQRSPKVYINDYSSDDKSGVELLKDLFDLSLLDGTKVNTDANGLITTDKQTGTDSKFKGHALLDDQVKSCGNLDFIFNSDVNYAPAEGSAGWSPIANNEGECFSGTVHGDGHHVSGLTASLFNHLCGDVYNLGVSGTFTGAGIAESGTGYVENCWVSTSSTAAKTSKPLFGSPTVNSGDSRPTRIVNCYYEENDGASNPYPVHTGNYGKPTKKDSRAFYNGEVTYDLNGFYLYKRYCDHTSLSNLGGSSATSYTYWQQGNTSALQTGHYGNDVSLCSAGYVEDRFADGDFIYAGGYVPEDDDVRMYVNQSTKAVSYYPIWPDDYFYFGQMLNYGHVSGQSHQDYPSCINRSTDALYTDAASNRVYRVPAYYGNKNMDVAHFNPNAVFASTKFEDATKVAYKGMTAIDFSAKGDIVQNSDAYEKDLKTVPGSVGSGKKFFYPPVLDDDGLYDLTNVDLTKNLLIYTQASRDANAVTPVTAAEKTTGVVSTYLQEPVYAETDITYRTVNYRDPGYIHGHWVYKSGDNYVANRDHLLVDKQDFNAPTAYTFTGGTRMWHQRNPSLFAQGSSGWDAISVPFEVSLVTTQTKGELTHFYEGSTIGHEYWLREYQDITNEGGNTDQMKAVFKYPSKQTGNSKNYTNTFLWDYYYSKNDRRDEHEDKYKVYYETSHTFDNYPLQQAGVPYLLGLPGAKYYEFDLSGEFGADDTYIPIAMLSKQMVTFASDPNISIGVSDDELAGHAVTHNGYTFKPSYSNTTISAGTDNYMLSATGDEYYKLADGEADQSVAAFRPYFVKKSSGAGVRRHIVFSQDNTEMHGVEEPKDKIDQAGGLKIGTKRRTIVVTSTLKEDKEVVIVNTAGQTVATFTISEGETVETAVQEGVYIVNRTKLLVK